MRSEIFLTAVFAILVGSCSQLQNEETLKREVFQTEKAFEAMTSEKGIAQAFYYFAADDAVIKRENDSLIMGKENIRSYYEKRDHSNVTINWTPDFIDISQSGDLAYTYGKYKWTVLNPAGDTSEYTGVFHTVWKRQKDNSWKYVWD